MKLRIVKRWNQRAYRFLFYIQYFEDDDSCPHWEDDSYPIDTEEEARVKVAQKLLSLDQDGEIVVAEF